MTWGHLPKGFFTKFGIIYLLFYTANIIHHTASIERWNTP